PPGARKPLLSVLLLYALLLYCSSVLLFFCSSALLLFCVYSLRAACTAWTTVRAFSAIFAKLPSAIALLSTSAVPTPMATAPALIQSPALARATPPAGIRLTWGGGRRR